MSTSKPTRKALPARRPPKIDPGQILADEIIDLVRMISRLKEKSLEEEDIIRMVRVTVGVGLSDLRLAGLLKALKEFEEHIDLADAFYQAILENFGSLPHFQALGESGPEEEDPFGPPGPPSGRQPQQAELPAVSGGEPSSAPTDPEPTGERPAEQAAAGRKSPPRKINRRKTGRGKTEMDHPGPEGAQQVGFDF